jgi:N-acetylmuramoyl-L-alanine amidase
MALIYKLGSRGETVKQIQRALAGAGYGVMIDGIYGSITEEAVRAFQTKNKLKADGIVGPATFAALVPFRWKKSKRTITELIVHCTATPEYKDYTVTDIRQWHKAQGWNDIGYHYVVYRDGSIHEGRSVDIAGAHCEGHNAHSIGICYIGGCASDGKTAKDTRTVEQKAALLVLLQELKRLYPQSKIHGHRDFAPKACPSFDATYEFRNI